MKPLLPDGRKATLRETGCCTTTTCRSRSPNGTVYGERSRRCGECRRTHHVAVCSLWTNPEGAELRFTVDGQAQLTEVSHHFFAVPIVALAWRERYHWVKGWR
jgi:hypothetical protein